MQSNTINYIPDIITLKNVISARNQKNIDNIEYYIGIRQHNDYNLLVDKLINILVSYINHNIYIYISTSDKLYNKINDEIKQLCEYIYINDTPTDLHTNTIKIITSTTTHIEKIDFKYFIWHSESEYYCSEFSDKYIKSYDYPDDELNKNSIEKYIEELNGWWWDKMKENYRFIEYLKKEKIYPLEQNSNSIILAKKYIVEFLQFYEEIKELINDDWCQAEILISTFMYYKYKLIMFRKNCKIYWNFCNDNPEKVLELHKENINNNSVDYLTIKRIDINYPDNAILNYLHETYMVEQLNKLFG